MGLEGTRGLITGPLATAQDEATEEISFVDARVLQVMLQRAYLMGKNEHSLDEEARNLVQEKKALKRQIEELKIAHAAEKTALVERSKAKVAVIYEKIKALTDYLDKASEETKPFLPYDSVTIYRQNSAYQHGEAEGVSTIYAEFYSHGMERDIEKVEKLAKEEFSFAHIAATSELERAVVSTPVVQEPPLSLAMSASSALAAFERFQQTLTETASALHARNDQLREKKQAVERLKEDLIKQHARELFGYRRHIFYGLEPFFSKSKTACYWLKRNLEEAAYIDTQDDFMKKIFLYGWQICDV